MAKPKQKSGLGKGLGALFNDATYTPAEEAQESTRASRKETQPVETAVDAIVDAPTPEAVAETFTEDSAGDIYISEEALENAKVVEREARPARSSQAATKTPTKRTATSGRATPVASRQKAAKKPTSQTASNASNASKMGTKASNQAAPLTQAPVASGAKAPQTEEKGLVGEVPLSQVHPNPNQPRTNFKPEEIEELAASIKRDGLLQPILVRRKGDHYEIIAGERRYQASKSIGMKTIPVRFWMADEDKALELALVENIQRSDLNPIEEAYGYKRLMERRGMTQSEVAQAVSKGRSTIANALRLLDLPEEAQQLLFEEKISAGHARAILSVPTVEGRKTLTNKLMNEKLSVRETEAIARLLAGREKAKDNPTPRAATPASYKKAARSMSKLLEMPVRVKTVQGKNKIEIQFKDEDELQRVVDALTNAKQ